MSARGHTPHPDEDRLPGPDDSAATAALSDSGEEPQVAEMTSSFALARERLRGSPPPLEAPTPPPRDSGRQARGTPPPDEPEDLPAPAQAPAESSQAIVQLPEPAESAEVPIPDLPPPPTESQELGASAAFAPRTALPSRAAPEALGREEREEPPHGFPEPPPLAVVDEGDERPVAIVPGSEHDVSFGELARLQRFITEEQLAEAIRISERLRGEGRPKKLGKIMVKLGYLTATQAKYLLRLQRTADPIDGYKLLERRGQGGMGVVYRAVQKSMKREVAVKILAPKWAQHARFLQRFFREAKLAGELNHPNVVSAIDVGESGGLHYYAMEYVDGWSVAEILKEDGAFDEDEALDIVVQVAKALEHAAEHHIVHRDVKPENILVTPDGVAKLADLGLSKQLTSDCTITTEGKTLGTPFYVSPELARGTRDVDARSDIYSLGATLYHMLVGEPPFAGDNPAAIMARHIAEEPVPVKRRRRDVSGASSKLVERMMAKDPARRYQNADELIRDIVAIRKGQNPFAPARAPDAASSRAPAARGPRRQTTAPERPVARRQYPRGAVAAAAIALAIAAVAFAIVVATQRRDRPAAPEAHADAVRPQDPPPAPSDPGAADREANARARLSAVREQVDRRLEQGRYDDARATISLAEKEFAGTAVEGYAREIRDHVRQETDRAIELAVRKARHELEGGRPDLALEIVRDAPGTETAELAADVARLKAEAEKAAAARPKR
jgi:serine/threonine-protein kinase